MIDNKHIEEIQIINWIKSLWEEPVEAVELLKVYRSNDWGVTARFVVRFGEEISKEVLCKIGFLPIFKTSPDIYNLLKQIDNKKVPYLIHGEFRDEKVWMLFEPFEGKAISEGDKLNSLKEIAAAMAETQLEAGKLLKEGASTIPVIEPVEIVGLFDTIMGKYLNQWKSEGETISKDIEIDLDYYREIFNIKNVNWLRGKIKDYSEELYEKHIPYSIDHLDLHSGNAARLSNNEIIIYDWEEAVVSCPFFSTDKLLDEARELDKGEKIASDVMWSQSQLAVIDSYIDELPWLESSDMRRAFDIAMCIAPIKYAYQSTFFIDQVGWQAMGAGLIAQSIIKAYERCRCVEVNK